MLVEKVNIQAMAVVVGQGNALVTYLMLVSTVENSYHVLFQLHLHVYCIRSNMFQHVTTVHPCLSLKHKSIKILVLLVHVSKYSNKLVHKQTL